jgi:hypothetical protein
MRPVTTRAVDAAVPAGPAILYLAFELGETYWKLAFTTGSASGRAIGRSRPGFGGALAGDHDGQAALRAARGDARGQLL